MSEVFDPEKVRRLVIGHTPGHIDCPACDEANPSNRVDLLELNGEFVAAEDYDKVLELYRNCSKH